MPLNLDAVGKTTKPITHTYRWQDVVLYALGVGAKRAELDFLIEQRGPKVLPTYAVVPSFTANMELFDVVGGNMLGVVHGGQKITLHRPFKPSDTLTTVGTVAGIYDLKRLATSVITTETRNGDGELVAETEWQIIYRLDGGFGGPPPPKSERVHLPDRAPDFRVEEATSPEQALLYRLSGDLNPLHSDPSIGEKAGFGGPILHGLCTYGYAGRALVAHACGGDPAKLKSFTGQFRNPVWPGDTLIIEGWNEAGRVLVRAGTKEHPESPVFAHAYATVA
ncbi:MAG: MaoC/PaaZ C-terminal domain-containing protein [Polyangiales bacterium]|nr:MaoC family dehydratase N-terminal domain-containing protein [Myxococcales bacterium]